MLGVEEERPAGEEAEKQEECAPLQEDAHLRLVGAAEALQDSRRVFRASSSPGSSARVSPPAVPEPGDGPCTRTTHQAVPSGVEVWQPLQGFSQLTGLQ